jgi:hypothetical protein
MNIVSLEDIGIYSILIPDLNARQSIILSALIDRRELFSDGHTGDLYGKTGEKIYSLRGVVDYLPRLVI